MLRKNIFYKVLSSSMYPTLNIGDIVVIKEKDPEEIVAGEKYGDILILKGPRYFYENGVDPIIWNNLPHDFPIIHRVINKIKIGELWYFQTKGDNSWMPDGCFQLKNKNKKYAILEYKYKKDLYVPETEILGVVIKKIPVKGKTYQEEKLADFLLDIKNYKKIEVKVYFK